MSSYNVKSQGIMTSLYNIRDAEDSFDLLERYARTVTQAGEELGVSASTKRVLELNMKMFQNTDHLRKAANPVISHFQGTPDTGVNNSSNMSNSTVPPRPIDDQYRDYAKGVMKQQAAIDAFGSQKEELKRLSIDLSNSLQGTLNFSLKVNSIQDSFKDRVMNHLYAKGLKDIYRVEEQQIWLLGWLLFSRDQFLSWSIRPKDMISDPSKLSTLNSTDFMIINDYLDDLIMEAQLRGVLNDFDNSRFVFQIMRGMKFNITDIHNVTNCTNSMMTCPCAPDRSPDDTSYCQNTTNSSNSTSNSSTTANGTKRVLQTATPLPPPFNTINSTGPKTSSSPYTAPDPFAQKKSDNDPLTQAMKPPQKNFGTAPMVITPFTAIQSFELNYPDELDIRAFVTAYRIILTQYMRTELMGPLPTK